MDGDGAGRSGARDQPRVPAFPALGPDGEARLRPVGGCMLEAIATLDDLCAGQSDGVLNAVIRSSDAGRRPHTDGVGTTRGAPGVPAAGRV